MPVMTRQSCHRKEPLVRYCDAQPWASQPTDTSTIKASMTITDQIANDLMLNLDAALALSLSVCRLMEVGNAILKVVVENLHGTHAEGLRALQQVVNESVIPRRLHVTPERFKPCDNAVALLHRTQPSVLDNYVPVFVVGDGNCLFRSVSLACYGTEAGHCHLRGRSAAEMLLHPEWYDACRADRRHPLRSDPDILLPEYEDACLEIAGLGQAVGVTALLALSAVIGYPIYTFWPPINGSLVTSPRPRVFVGRGVAATEKTVNLMWSSAGVVPATGAVAINHFVPLLRKSVRGNGDGDVEEVERVVVSYVHIDSESSVLQDGAICVDDESDVLTESDHADSHGMKRPVDVGEDDMSAAKRDCVTGELGRMTLLQIPVTWLKIV